MSSYLQQILDWSEVWALLIPLAVLLKYRKQPDFLRPVIIYLWLALFLDLLIDVSWLFNEYVPAWLKSNNFLYNIHSIVRFVCFSSFFILLKQPILTTFKKLLPLFSLLFILINFTFFEDFFEYDYFSSRLLAGESALLLFYCLQYYLFKLQEDPTAKRQADFWVVTGLSIYVVFNFPYFLFYTTLLNKGNKEFVVFMWNFHNITFIILCIFIARAFYVSGHK